MMGNNNAKPLKGSKGSKTKTSKPSKPSKPSEPFKVANAVYYFFSALSAIKDMDMNIFGRDKPTTWQELLSVYLQTGSIAACALSVLQGNSALEQIGIKIQSSLEAQTALQAPAQFAKHVSNFITSMAAQVQSGDYDHLYFLYHPDTDWHGEFHKIMSKTDPSRAYCGMSENLNAICNWMAFIRHCLANDQSRKRPRKIVRFHLLIPVYRPLVIEEPLEFDRRLFPLTIHAHIHNSQETVWLNLPGMRYLESTELSLDHVGNIAELPPPSACAWEQGVAWVQNLFQSPQPQTTTVLGADTPVPDNPNHPGQHSPLDKDFHVQSKTNYVSDERRGRRHHSEPGRSKPAHAKRRR